MKRKGEEELPNTIYEERSWRVGSEVSNNGQYWGSFWVSRISKRIKKGSCGYGFLCLLGREKVGMNIYLVLTKDRRTNR